MTIGIDALDSAEYTFCYDQQTARNADGAIGIQLRQLPWAFVKFAGPGEERKYIVPINGVSFIIGGFKQLKLELAEFMPNKAFPLDNQRPFPANGPAGDNAPGRVSVHYYGYI